MATEEELVKRLAESNKEDELKAVIDIAAEEDPKIFFSKYLLGYLAEIYDSIPKRWVVIKSLIKATGKIDIKDLEHYVKAEDKKLRAVKRAERSAGCTSCGCSEPEPEPEPIDPEITRKALLIAEHGDPMKYLIFNAQRQHLGDIHCQKVILLSICSASSLTSSGIQPGFTGDSGSGKDDATSSIYTMVPNEYRFKGSLSAKTLLYNEDIKPGMIIYSPDVQYETIIPIFKVSTGDFQHPTVHHTVSTDREYEMKTLAERQVFILTSVESVDNKEAANRQFPISTDSEEDHKKLVSKEISERRSRKELRFVEDEGTIIGKAIFQDIYDNGPFRVIIPQARNAEWLLPAEFRGQNQFWDLVDAFTVLRWRQRKFEDGWLVADDQDVIDAIELMYCFKSGHILDLTPAEIELVQTMAAGGKFTQAAIAEALGISQPTVSLRLKSIMGKTGIVIEHGDYGTKRYGLTQDGINSLMNTDVGLVKVEGLKEDSVDFIGELLYCYRYVIGIPIDISINISNRIPSSLLICNPEHSKNISCTINLHERSCDNCKCVKYLFSADTPITAIIQPNQQVAA